MPTARGGARAAAMAVLVALFVLHVWQCAAGFDVSRPLASPTSAGHEVAATGVVAPIADQALVAAALGSARAGSASPPAGPTLSYAGSVLLVGVEQDGPTVGEVATTCGLILLTVGIAVLVAPLRRWVLRAPARWGSPGRGPERGWSGRSLFQLCVLRT